MVAQAMLKAEMAGRIEIGQKIELFDGKRSSTLVPYPLVKRNRGGSVPIDNQFPLGKKDPRLVFVLYLLARDPRADLAHCSCAFAKVHSFKKACSRSALS